MVTLGFLYDLMLPVPKYYDMQEKIYDIDGSYITIPQIRFYLNREDRKEQVATVFSRSEFQKYLKVCKAYNLVSELADEYPEEGFFYWDEDKGCVSFAFKEDGSIDKLLSSLGITILDFGDGQDI